MEMDFGTLNMFLQIDGDGFANNKLNEEKFADYHNFFEFMTVLKKTGT
jgi:hypothetical protein